MLIMGSAFVAIPAAAADAQGATCFGKHATQVGNNQGNSIVVKPHAVVAALAGNDTIRVGRADPTKHVICGGPGKDDIEGANGNDVLVGGPGDDKIYGKHGNDLMIGDNANPRGAESGATGRDDLVGGYNNDFIVGDNYAYGDASGASSDKALVGDANKDTLVGDDFSAHGDATGGANDMLYGAKGTDRVIGDSDAPHGTATGGGDDHVNAGPGIDLEVGDNYTFNGMAIGGGDDRIHAADGGDAGAKCRPHACDDALYGDNFAGSCGLQFVSCDEVSGGGVDLLNADQGADFMNGGTPDDPALHGKGDKCSGGDGRDTATRCEYVYKDVEVVRPFP